MSTRSPRICPSCRTYLAGAPTCRRCVPVVSSAGSTAAKAFATGLRTQAATGAATASPPISSGSLWGSVTGEVRREQEAILGRARGTTALTLGACLLTVAAAIASGATSSGAVTGAAASCLLLALVPVVLIIVLLSIGRGGPLTHVRRMAGNSLAVGMSMGSMRRPRRGSPGRVLIVGDGTTGTRIAVARMIDMPVGSTVTVHGPRIAGYRHAWLIRTHGLDSHPLPARGVLLAFAAAALGVVAIVAAVLGALGSALS
jgi:hypothetical protein